MSFLQKCKQCGNCHLRSNTTSKNYNDDEQCHNPQTAEHDTRNAQTEFVAVLFAFDYAHKGQNEGNKVEAKQCKNKAGHAQTVVTTRLHIDSLRLRLGLILRLRLILNLRLFKRLAALFAIGGVVCIFSATTRTIFHKMFPPFILR